MNNFPINVFDHNQDPRASLFRTFNSDGYRTTSAIQSYELTRQGADVTLSTKGGILVFNQVYTPFWQAYCGTEKLPIIPVNGIMMAAFVPKQCNTVKFRYQPK